MDLKGKPWYQILATDPNFCKNFGTIYIFAILLLSIMFHSKSSANMKKKTQTSANATEFWQNNPDLHYLASVGSEN